MTTLQIAYKASTKTVSVQAKGKTPTAGHTVVGAAPRTLLADPAGNQGAQQSGHDVGKVLYHHVRDALYLQGVQDMSKIAISVDPAFTAATGVSVTPTTAAKTVGGTQQLTPTIAPGGATDTAVTYKSSDSTIATVDANGLVTAKKAGVATITVTSDDGDFTASCVVTVS